MKEPPLTIVISDENSLLKALSTVLALMEREFVIAAEQVQARKSEEN